MTIARRRKFPGAALKRLRQEGALGGFGGNAAAPEDGRKNA